MRKNTAFDKFTVAQIKLAYEIVNMVYTPKTAQYISAGDIVQVNVPNYLPYYAEVLSV